MFIRNEGSPSLIFGRLPACRRFFVVGRIKVRFFGADGRRGADEKLLGAIRQPAFRQEDRPYVSKKWKAENGSARVVVCGGGR